MLITFRLVQKILKLIMCSIALGLIFYLQSNSTRQHGRLKDGNYEYHNISIAIKEPENLDLIYILIWHSDYEFSHLSRGQDTFVVKQCKYTNCFISRDRNMLSNNYMNYNAFLFGGKSLKHGFINGCLDVPRDRDKDQIYIFAMQDDAETNPICHMRFDNYFNLTWTYKLDSDVVWPFFHMIDRRTHENVAPKINTEWRLVNKQSDMIYEIQKELLNKRDFGVWISNKRQTQSLREKIVAEIKKESDIHGHTLDILGAYYSECNNTAVSEKVLRPYTFFLAFESVLTDDYVTVDVVEAIKQKCLPVVYGGANYSRFLPPHSYIDATALGPRETARLMGHLMTDVARYFAYFDWHTSYAVKKDKGESACNLCEALNQKRRGSHAKLRKWWNPHYETVCSISE